MYILERKVSDLWEEITRSDDLDFMCNLKMSYICKYEKDIFRLVQVIV